MRGALNKILSLLPNNLSNGIVCASAGNHAQGFAYCCSLLNIKGDIFVLINTPTQKLDKIYYYSNKSCNIIKYGSQFDDNIDNKNVIIKWINGRDSTSGYFNLNSHETLIKKNIFLLF